jgi:hypothetical protein
MPEGVYERGDRAMTPVETAERVRELSVTLKSASDELTTLVGSLYYTAEDVAKSPDDTTPLAEYARDYVRIDREINFHLRCTVAGEGVPGEYQALCKEREEIVGKMASIVDREAACD